MNKTLVILSSILVVSLVGLGVLYIVSSEPERTVAMVTFSKDPQDPSRNVAIVAAPADYYVIRYRVAPNNAYGYFEKNPLDVISKTGPSKPVGKKGVETFESDLYPASGQISDIPFEAHVLIAVDPNAASPTTQYPLSQAMLDRCGEYIIVTKDPTIYDRAGTIVQGWRFDEVDQEADQEETED